jgi:hypothetical protein
MKTFNQTISFIACAAFGLAMQSPLKVYSQAFLFEDVPAGDHAGSFTVTEGSQTLTLTPEGYPNGSVTVLLRASPMDHGVTGNQGSTPTIGLFAPLRFSFATPVTAITFGFLDSTPGSPPGTGGGDIDGSVTIKAYDSANNLLTTMLYNNPTYDGGTYQTLSGSFSGASYFIASTASPFDNLNSLTYEIVSSTSVPEPASLALILVGGSVLCGGMAARRRQA